MSNPKLFFFVQYDKGTCGFLVRILTTTVSGFFTFVSVVTGSSAVFIVLTVASWEKLFIEIENKKSKNAVGSNFITGEIKFKRAK